MFFEASSIGCRKTTYDVIKVTYNMYSCDTYCMSREMMKMNGRDRSMCQIVIKRDKMGILEILNDNKTKNPNSGNLLPLIEDQKMQ